MLPVPFLALVAFGMVVSGAVEGGIEGMALGLLTPGIGGALDSMRPLIAMATGVGFTLLSLVVLMPVLIRWCWGLRPLLSQEADRAIAEELKANGVKVARVLAWPEQMTGVVTAGVIGVLPGFRYLLFGNLLAAALTPQEIRSITAHEAAHLRFRHPAYYVLAVLACILLVQSASQGIQLAGLVLGNPVPSWAVLFGELAGLILLLRFGFGAMSRHFEREADGHAFTRQGLDAFQTALSKVGKLNGIPTEINNWHHFGISHRIGYLAQVQGNPRRLGEHTRTVHRLKLLWVLLFAAGVALQAAVSASPIIGQAAERYWERRISAADSGERPLGRADLPGLHALAMIAYERQDLKGAERYYRVILRVAPDDAQTQNNLAWLLVTRPSADASTVREGLSLAKQAAQAREMAFIWDTLAEAYGRAGQIAQAHAAAEKALHLAEQGQGLGEVRLDYYRQRVQAFPGDGTVPLLPEALPKPPPPRHPAQQRPAPKAEPPAGVRMV
jgi:Zn-dependent protease with chaperone function